MSTTSNLKDLIDIPKKVLTDLKIIPVEHMDEVLGIALYPPQSDPPRWKRLKDELVEEE